MMTRMKTKEKLPLAALPQKNSNNSPKNWLLQYTKNDLKCVPTNKLYLNWQGLCRRLKMTLEAEEKREEKKRQERLEEAERNRKHEIEIAKIYTAAFASNNQNSIQATTPTYFAPTSAITRTLTSPQTSSPQQFHSATPSPLTSSPSIPANFSFQDDPNMSFYRSSKHFS